MVHFCTCISVTPCIINRLHFDILFALGRISSYQEMVFRNKLKLIEVCTKVACEICLTQTHAMFDIRVLFECCRGYCLSVAEGIV